MKPLWAMMLLLATLHLVSAAPVRPKLTKAKAVAPVGHRPASRSEAEQQKKPVHRGKVAVRRVVVRRMVHGRWVQVSRVVRVKAVPVIPPHPDPDRLREIQQAMSDKGYFKGEVNGVWNADSVEALKQFQTVQNLAPDGKITALSLTGLGLGPKHDGTVAAIPKQNIPQ
jgi:hypothetical protein